MTTPQTIGAFTVDAEIGRGGMGVVYRGTDPTLGRTVAIKVLPSAWARDSERVARLRREARTMASLTHPNVAAVHAFIEKDGEIALVMEFAPGETLDARLNAGPLPVDDALRICSQIAAGVEAAHEAGVVHRDLKPGNVMLGADHSVKVLDFGLAKSPERATSGSGSVTNAPTLIEPVEPAATLPGVVMGTAPYMSPEQARGRAVDRRTDIWSFGCVLWECLTGRRLFEGETTTDILAAIVEREPDWSKLPRNTPLRVRELLVKCLEKDAKKRLRDIGDARLELDRALANREWSTSSLTAWPGMPAPRRRLNLGWAAAALCAAVAIVAVFWSFGRPPAGDLGRATYLDLAAGRGLTIDAPYLSPDGRHALHWLHPDDWTTIGSTEEPRLHLRSFDTGESVDVPQSAHAWRANFSPDSRSFAFLAPESEGSDRLFLYKAPSDLSTPPSRLATLPKRSVSFLSGGLVWTPSDEILVHGGFAPGYIQRFSASDGRELERLELTFAPGVDHVSVDRISDLLPDGRHLLVESWGYSKRGWAEHVSVVDLTTGVVQTIVENGSCPFYDARSRRLVFSRGSTIVAAPFDANTRRVTGPIEVVQGGLRTPDPWSAGWINLSDSGDLAFHDGEVGGTHRRMAIREPDGAFAPWSSEPMPFAERQAFDASGDGRLIAATLAEAGGLYEVWITESDRPRWRRLASEPSADCIGPEFNADGSLLAYSCHVGSRCEVRVIPTNMGLTAEPVARFTLDAPWTRVVAFSHDGSSLLVSTGDPAALMPGMVLFVADLNAPEPTPRIIAPITDLQYDFALSPSGKWLAAITQGPRSEELVLRRVGPDWSLGQPIVVREARNEPPVWLNQGDPSGGDAPQFEELAFLDWGELFIVRAPLADGEPVGEATPQPRFEHPGAVLGLSALPDRRLLVLLQGQDEAPPTTCRIAHNWAHRLLARP